MAGVSQASGPLFDNYFVCVTTRRKIFQRRETIWPTKHLDRKIVGAGTENAKRFLSAYRCSLIASRVRVVRVFRGQYVKLRSCSFEAIRAIRPNCVIRDPSQGRVAK